MINKKINKVAVLGSGIMGSRIACHFANIGVEVLLLDIVPKEGPRNSIVDAALQNAVKTNPSPIYSKKVLNKITTGNFEDDMPKIAGYDWIIEVVVENLDIKKKVFDQVEQYRKPEPWLLPILRVSLFI